METIEREIQRFLESEPYSVVGKFYAGSPGNLHYIASGKVREQPPRKLKVLIGEFCHNLRSSLDNLADILATKPPYPAPSTERRKMMGQQETTMTMATEEKGGGALLLRRMVLVLAAAALMAVMMAVSALPAMAKVNPEKPGQNGGGPPQFTGNPDPGNATVFHDPVNGGVCVLHDTGPASTRGSC